MLEVFHRFCYKAGTVGLTVGETEAYNNKLSSSSYLVHCRTGAWMKDSWYPQMPYSA